MAKASRVGYGALSGAAGGAGLGTAIVPGIGTAIGAIGGGLLGALGSAFGDNGVSEEDIAKQREFLRRRQTLERENERFQNDARIAGAMRGVYGRHGGDESLFAADPYMQTIGARTGMLNRSQQLQSDMFEDDARRQLEGQDPTWQDWMGGALGLGGAIAQGVRGANADPMASRKQNLSGAADEAAYIRSLPLSGSALTTALDENDEKTRSALYGSRYRMSPYDF